MSRRLSESAVTEKLRSLGIIYLGGYVNSKKPIKVKFLECGHTSNDRSYAVLLGGHGCKECGQKIRAKKRMLTEDQITSRLAAKGIEYLSGYQGALKPVKVRFLECGHITSNQQYSALVGGHGCNKCHNIKSAKKRMLTEEEVTSQLAAKGMEYLGGYSGRTKPVKVKFIQCGHVSTERIYSVLLRGHGCKECGAANRSKRRSLSEEEVRSRLAAKGIEYLGGYTNSLSPIRVRFQKCGHITSSQRYSVLVRGSGCKECGYAKRAKSRMLTEDEVTSNLAKIGIEYLGGFSGSANPVTVRFKACGHVTKTQRYSVLIQGHGCTKCKHVQAVEYETLAKKHGGQILQMGRSGSEKSKWKCYFGCEFYAPYNQLKYSNAFCTECSKSLGERVCKFAFEQIFHVPFEKIKLKDLRGLGGGQLEFDLYAEVDGLKIAVEHQGSHHYRKRHKKECHTRLTKQQKHDQMKREYAISNNVYLFEIPELFTMTSLANLKDVIRAEAQRLGCKLPQLFDDLILEISPAKIAPNSIIQFERLKKFAEKDGYKLIEEHFLGGHEFHTFECTRGHRIRIKAYSFFQGHRCKHCYELDNCKPVICSNGKVYTTANAAGKDFGYDSGSIHSALNKKHLMSDHAFLPIPQKDFKLILNDTNILEKYLMRVKNLQEELLSKRCPVITSSGKVFENMSKCAGHLNAPQSSVAQAILRDKGTVGGIGVRKLSWDEYKTLSSSERKREMFIKTAWPEGIKKRDGKRKTVYASDGRSFPSASECAEKLGVSISSVSTTVKRRSKCKGLLLSYSPFKDENSGGAA